ncbi:MAG: UPF0280 family protein [Promethearchaeota archaeon]
MDLQKYRIHFTYKESDVTIISNSENFFRVAYDSLITHRRELERFIAKYPIFKSNFKPLRFPDDIDMPIVIERMIIASEIADVGPMAAVAGALADLMVEEMVKKGGKIAVVENGGEIFIHSIEDIYIRLYSMTTILQGKIGFKFKGGSSDLGVGTSSGTFGHAISLGNADTVTVFAENAAIADATATRIANSVKGDDDETAIGKGLEVSDSLEKVKGVFISKNKLVGYSGRIPELFYIKEGDKKYITSKLSNILPKGYKEF